jgi:prepilin-type N-terminal cleavage/methylation domain-containing protein
MLTTRRGFTLIELLVVISIIALLIAILLPALEKARRSAKNVKCLSSLHQMSIGMNGYASDNDGFIPPRMLGGPAHLTPDSPRDLPRPMGQPFWTYFARYGGESWGLGRLYTDEYISNGRVFYCPLQEFRAFTYEPYVESGPYKGQPYMSVENQQYRTAYTYNPHTVQESGGRFSEFTRMAAFPNDRIMIMDIVDRLEALAHSQRSGFNLLFANGSARGKNSTEAVDLLKTQNTAFRGFGPFDKVLRILEGREGE